MISRKLERKKEERRKNFSFFLLSFLFLALGHATTYLELSLDDLINQTELAFYGEVTAVEVVGRSGEPWTQVSFQVTEALLGLDAETESVTLEFYGGELNGRSLRVNLMPSFSVGEAVLVLAYNSAELYSPVVGFRQGLWRDTGLGLVDAINRTLSLDAEGELSLDGAGGGLDDILAALQVRLEEAQ